MKKILFAAMAALAITSCSQNEEIEAPAQKSAINFKTVVNKTNRTAPTVNDNFSNFKVFAYNTGESALADVSVLNTTTFMPGVEVEHKGSPLAWTINGTYYWPTTANVQFFAYSPMASTALSNWVATSQYPSFSYTVNDVASQEDLIIAQAIDKNKTSNADAGVSLSFKHILTQINFSAKGETDGYSYTISSIKIDKVHDTSTYTFAGADDTPSGTWGTATHQIESPYIYTCNYSSSASGSTDAINLAQADNALLLMPQTLPDDAVITVNYSVKDTNTNEIFNGNGEVSLKGATWEAGKSINYILKLSNNGKEVSFNPSVSDTWGNGGDANDHPTPEPAPVQP